MTHPDISREKDGVDAVILLQEYNERPETRKHATQLWRAMSDRNKRTILELALTVRELEAAR